VLYLGQLVLLKEKTLLARPNFGTKSAEEVKFILSTKGAYLGMTHPDLDTFIADLKAGKTKTEKI
jgi:DNA-directed RNA polymerase alpha subunit